MTGTEPSSATGKTQDAHLSSNDAALARRPLSRLFFNFTCWPWAPFVAIAFTADFVISTAQRHHRRLCPPLHARHHHAGSRTNSSAIPGIVEKHPGPWTTVSPTALDIVERISLDRVLTSAQVLKLDAGDIAIDHDGEVEGHRLGNTSKVLVVGPLAASRNPGIQERIPWDLRLRPDLEPDRRHLRDCALVLDSARGATSRHSARPPGDFGDGNLRPRLTARSQLFAPMALTFERHGRAHPAAHRHPGNCLPEFHELRTPICAPALRSRNAFGHVPAKRGRFGP